MRMQYFNSKGYKLELRSSRNDLTKQTKFKSSHRFFMALGVDTHTHIHMKVQGRAEGGFQGFQETPLNFLLMKIWKIEIL